MKEIKLALKEMFKDLTQLITLTILTLELLGIIVAQLPQAQIVYTVYSVAIIATFLCDYLPIIEDKKEKEIRKKAKEQQLIKDKEIKKQELYKEMNLLVAGELTYGTLCTANLHVRATYENRTDFCNQIANEIKYFCNKTYNNPLIDPNWIDIVDKEIKKILKNAENAETIAYFHQN